MERNQPSLFDPKSSRDMPGQNGTNRDNLTGGEGQIPGQTGTPPLKGGVQCPDVTGRDMSLSCPDPAEAFKNRNDIKTAFDRWDAEWRAWAEAGMVGDYPHPPAGLTSAIASRLIPRRNREARTWRK